MKPTKTTLFWEVTETVNGTNKVASGSTTVDGDRNRAMAHWDVYFAPHGYRLVRDDLDEQTDYANDEIARQLREIGILEPLKPVATENCTNQFKGNTNMSNPQFDALEEKYLEAAGELRSKQVELGNFAPELQAFIEARDALKEHPDFSGNLPKTYYSGGDLDPVGYEEADNDRPSS